MPDLSNYDLRMAYIDTFRGDKGEKVLEDLYDFCGLMDPCFVEGAADATAWREGMRRVALRLHEFINGDPEKGSKLQKEAEYDDTE